MSPDYSPLESLGGTKQSFEKLTLTQFAQERRGVIERAFRAGKEAVYAANPANGMHVDRVFGNVVGTEPADRLYQGVGNVGVAAVARPEAAPEAFRPAAQTDVYPANVVPFRAPEQPNVAQQHPAQAAREPISLDKARAAVSAASGQQPVPQHAAAMAAEDSARQPIPYERSMTQPATPVQPEIQQAPVALDRAAQARQAVVAALAMTPAQSDIPEVHRAA